MCAYVCVCVCVVAEDKLGWHGKPLPKDLAESVVKELQGRMVSSSKRLYPAPPCEDAPPVSLRNIRMPSAPSYKLGEKVGGGGYARDASVMVLCCFNITFYFVEEEHV